MKCSSPQASNIWLIFSYRDTYPDHEASEAFVSQERDSGVFLLDMLLMLNNSRRKFLQDLDLLKVLKGVGLSLNLRKSLYETRV